MTAIDPGNIDTGNIDPASDAIGRTIRFNDFSGNKPALSYFPMFDELREEAPFFRGDAGTEQQFIMFTRMDSILEAFQHPQTFSNTAVVPAEPNPPYKWIPEMLDPPEHTKWRQLLSVFFTPGAINELEGPVRRRAIEIIEPLISRGECDFAEEFALRFPNSIFMDLMGLPQEDATQFMVWEHMILHTDHNEDVERKIPMQGMMEVVSYFEDLIAVRRKNPQEDILSAAIGWKIDGKEIPKEDLLALCLLLFMGGLDTVATQLGYMWLHFATHPDDRARLINEPDVLPLAIEEMLRYYAFVTPGRKTMHDTVLGGCPVKAGQMVFLPLVAANRDPREFDNADQVILDRSPNRHIAFGAGPHRCLGSYLARRELKIAFEEWHQRIPDYRLADGAVVTEHGMQIGLHNLPIVWDR